MEIKDLLKSALTKDAIGFKTAFSEIMQPRVAEIITSTKQEVAKSFFNKKPE